MATRFSGKNTKVYYGGSTKVEQLVSVDGIEQSCGDIEYTEAESTATQSLAGINDGKEFTFTVNYNQSLTTHTYLDSNIGLTVAWEVRTTQGSATVTYSCSGYVNSGAIQQLSGSQLQQKVYKVKVDGDWTISSS